MNVKGSIFIEVVKMVKKNKGLIYSKYLTKKDREFIKQNLFPSSWYPYEPYKHCLSAAFEVIAKNDLQVATQWGRTSCQATMTDIYKSVIKDCDPRSFLEKHEAISKSYYDFGKTEMIIEGENQALCKLSDFDNKFAPLHCTIQGWLERGLELCGAENVRSEMVTKSWEKQPFTSIRFTWE